MGDTLIYPRGMMAEVEDILTELVEHTLGHRLSKTYDKYYFPVIATATKQIKAQQRERVEKLKYALVDAANHAKDIAEAALKELEE